jgi:hypothetical protein
MPASACARLAGELRTGLEDGRAFGLGLGMSNHVACDMERRCLDRGRVAEDRRRYDL